MKTSKQNLRTSEGRAAAGEELAGYIAELHGAIVKLGAGEARAIGWTRLAVNFAFLIVMAASLPRSIWWVIRPREAVPATKTTLVVAPTVYRADRHIREQGGSQVTHRYVTGVRSLEGVGGDYFKVVVLEESGRRADWLEIKKYLDRLETRGVEVSYQ